MAERTRRHLFIRRPPQNDESLPVEQLSFILADGLIYASWLFIVSVGLTLVFGVLRILNMAHGSLYAVGSYVGASVVTWLAPHGVSGGALIVAMICVAFIVAAAVGAALERGVLARFHGRSEVTFLFVTYAILLIVESIILAVWGVQPYYASEPYMTFGQITLGPLSYVGYDVFLIAVAVLIGVSLHLLMTRTVFGRLTVAVINNPMISAAMGVRLSRVYVTMFVLGTFLAMLAGALTAPMLAVQPGMGINLIVLSFAVVVIGGLGSIPGAALGALIVGLARSLSVHMVPELELFAVFLVMSLVLIVRPEGIFAGEAPRRI